MTDFKNKILGLDLAFDDVLLLPRPSSVLPSEADLASHVTKNVRVSLPFLTAPMDTVTESKMAISIACLGGLGIIHRNLSVDEQVAEVDRVKRSETGRISNPVTCSPNDTLETVEQLLGHFHISGLPVVDEAGLLVGIITNRDLRFSKNPDALVHEIMTKAPLVTGSPDVTFEQAMAKFAEHKIEKLPLVDAKGKLCGLITTKDIEKTENFPFATKDEAGRLRVGAAVGVGEDGFKRADALIHVGVDVIIVDTAHGGSIAVVDTVKRIKKEYGDKVDVVGGNVADAASAKPLFDAGADGVKVGVGPGAICTTRVVTGVGRPQFSAILEVAEAAESYGVPIIGDGGLRYTGDIGKALGAGASAVMSGRLFAGTDETPGEPRLVDHKLIKDYRGMGSIGAMSERGFSKDRYSQQSVKSADKLVPEGIEGTVPAVGPVERIVHQLQGGLRQTMGYVGTPTVEVLRCDAQFVQVTPNSLNESHPSVAMGVAAPNYPISD